MNGRPPPGLRVGKEGRVGACDLHPSGTLCDTLLEVRSRHIHPRLVAIKYRAVASRSLRPSPLLARQ